MTTAIAPAPTSAGAGAATEPRKIVARDDIAPSGKQRSYIARLTLDLLGVPFPESRRDAAELIDRLRERIAAQSAGSLADEIPF